MDGREVLGDHLDAGGEDRADVRAHHQPHRRPPVAADGLSGCVHDDLQRTAVGPRDHHPADPPEPADRRQGRHLLQHVLGVHARPEDHRVRQGAAETAPRLRQVSDVHAGLRPGQQPQCRVGRDDYRGALARQGHDFGGERPARTQTRCTRPSCPTSSS